MHKLPSNHLVCSLIDPQSSVPTSQNFIYLDSLTNQQHPLIKSHLVNMVNRFNEIFPSFIPLHSEFSPRLRIIDNFSDHISFNVCNKGKDGKHYAYQLDNLALKSSSSPSTAIIASKMMLLHLFRTRTPTIHLSLR